MDKSSPYSIFDRGFVANKLNEVLRCPKCYNEYSNMTQKNTSSKDVQVKSNRPFLLPCEHNMCENCIHHNRKNLTCSKCLKPVEIRRNEKRQFSNFQVRDYFDMNFFLLGEIYHWRYYRKNATVNNSMMIACSIPNTIPLQSDASRVSLASGIKCAECDVEPSVGKCRLCKACYCKRCFNNIHKNSRALKTHKLQRYDLEWNSCTHEMRAVKSYFCKRHQRRCDCFCLKCDFLCCGECAKNDHKFHNYRKVEELNKELTEELNITLENAQMAYDNLQKGQKSIKAVETQLEEYAIKALEEISNHFLQLHSFLQIEEKQIIETFNNLCQQPHFKLREANAKLNNYQKTINDIRNNLQSFQESQHKNIYLGHLLPKCDQQIQQLPSQIEIVKLRHNPFNFEVKHDIRADIRNSISYGFKEPKITVLFNNSLYDSNPTYSDTSTSMVSSLNLTEDTSASFTMNVKQKAKQNNKNENQNPNENINRRGNNNPNEMSNISMSNQTMATSVSVQGEPLVHITHIKSPENFYVQNVNDIQAIRQLSHTYLLNDFTNRIPKSISLGYYYMAYHVTDKQWYRAMLKKILANDLYKIFLVDFGTSMEISKEHLCDIEEQHLRVPFAAMRCAICDIMPANKKWTDHENSLLIELLQNKPARMSIIERINDELCKIDLHTHLTKSVRDTFLYTGLARERPGQYSFRLQSKTKPQTIKIEERIPKINMHSKEVLAVTMLHAVGPEEFYVIKNDAIKGKEELIRDLNQYYNENETKIQQIYLGHTQMCCAVKVNDIWYRAIIDDVKGQGILSVRLADEGRKETINWRDAYILVEQFRKKREFAIPCTLADIEPLQKNNYVYTCEAINHFKQMTKNPNLRMEVVAVTPIAFKVALFICKKNIEKNIAAAMVDNRHGISTGEHSQVTENVRSSENFVKTSTNQSTIKSKDKLQKLSEDTLAEPLKRTPVIVTHLVSPGEFYIQLASLSLGTKTFHQQIQEAQAKKYGTKHESLPLSHETREWFKDDHCLVYTKYCSYSRLQLLDEHLTEHCEWYRGIITDITYPPGKERTFSVYLRDIGIIICSINSQQLFSINEQLDRVTNAVYCCHLACIEPAGGETWSQSAIDCFSHYITSAETLSVSLQGKRNSEMNSLPIVLWSSKVETTDPLAPCITKYSNINRNLITKGLAHMVEPLDTKQQFDQIEKLELKNGEISLEEWFETFSNNALLKDIEKDVKPSSHFSPNTCNDSAEINDGLSVDNHPLNIYLTEIRLKETTNKKAPATWLKSIVNKKTIFAGYPTYIDHESIVYLHDAADKPLLEKITTKITEVFTTSEPPSNDYKFIIGQACVVKYHLDNKYYRGIITEDLNADLEWGVYFVDYGNVETVKTKDLRPYAPYPNLPALTNKFLISGIKPKDEASKKYKEHELDQMHILIVSKLVSIRVHSADIKSEIKRCSIRIGNIDAANEFIERGLAEADRKPLTNNNSPKTATKQRRIPDNAKKIRKNPNTFNDNYTISTQDQDMSISLMNRDEVEEVDEDNERFLSNHSINNVDVDNDSSNNDDIKYSHLSEMFDRLSKKPNEQEPMTNTTKETATMSSVRNKPPPAKKRMFNDNDYTKMMKDILVLDNDDYFNVDDKVDNDDNDDDEDIIELGQSFEMNYWHNSADDMRLEEDEELNKILDQRELSSVDQEIESDFDAFYPNETSTVFSHFSGIESFRSPQLPAAMHHFNCRVVSIITPTILQIFPHHLEFRYREVEIQNCIRAMIKKSLPPLVNFEPRTLCLACYSKDKLWYRAIIRSYNPSAKTVDVLYVDYLNSETLPLKYIRQCPKELLGWPLRTFRVRLHGIKLNPHVKEHDVRLSLHRLLTKRKLFGVVKKHPNYQSVVAGNNCDNADILEIALYETKEDSLKGITVYQSLIENNTFQRC